MKLSVHGQVSDEGKFEPEDREGFRKALRAYAGRKVTIQIGGRRKPRSLSQNNVMWGLVIEPIALETGHDPEEVYGFMLEKFAPWVEDETMGRRRKTSSEFTTAEMEEFLAKVRQWAGEFLWMEFQMPNEGPASLAA